MTKTVDFSKESPTPVISSILGENIKYVSKVTYVYDTSEMKPVFKIIDIIFKRGYGTYPYVFKVYTGIILNCLIHNIGIKVINNSTLANRVMDIDNIMRKLNMVEVNSPKYDGNAYVFPILDNLLLSRKLNKLTILSSIVSAIVGGILLWYGLTLLTFGAFIIFTFSVMSYAKTKLLLKRENAELFLDHKFTLSACDACKYINTKKCITCPEHKKSN